MEFIDPLITRAIKEKAGEENKNSFDYYYSDRVLKPLKKFGLIEMRLVGKGESYEKDEEYRKTALYDRFIEFDLNKS